MVVSAVPPFPPAMQITVRPTPVLELSHTWGISARSRQFPPGGEPSHHSLGRYSIRRDLPQNRLLGLGQPCLCPYLYRFRGLDLVGLFHHLWAYYSPPFNSGSLIPVYAIEHRASSMRVYFTLTSISFISFFLASSTLGSITFNTPLSKVVSTLSLCTPVGSWNARWKDP